MIRAHEATWEDGWVFVYVNGRKVATMTAEQALSLARDLESCAGAVTEDDNHQHVANGHGCCRVCGRRVECRRCRNPYDEDVDAWGICGECWSHE